MRWPCTRTRTTAQRIRVGKELAEAKRKEEEGALRRAAEERKREKEEEARARCGAGRGMGGGRTPNGGHRHMGV
jgi:hypothetical protein